MARVPISYSDLGGGINRGVSPEQLPSRQMVYLINFYPYMTSLKRRGGYRQIADISDLALGTTKGMIMLVTPRVFLSTVGNIDHYSDQTFDLIGAGQTGFFKVSGGSAAIINYLNGSGGALGIVTSIPSSEKPWTMLQYKGIVYALRKDVFGSFFRITKAGFFRAGINGSNTGAPTLSAAAGAGAGTFPAGTYTIQVIFKNSQTGLFGGDVPGDPVLTTTVVLGGTDDIDVTVPVSTIPQVDTREIYVNLPGTTADDGLYLVATISDNSTTAKNLAAPPTATSTRLVRSLVPPDRNDLDISQDLFTGDIWRERLWATDGRDVFFSEFFQPEQFNVESSISVAPDDGYSITAIKAWGDRLVVGKTNAIYYITGNDLASFSVGVLSDHIGCASALSMKVIGNALYWVGSDLAVYRSDGSGDPQKISDPFLTLVLEAGRITDPEQLHASVRADRGWYILSYPDGFHQEGSEEVYRFLIYDYRQNVWTMFSGPGEIGAIADNYDSTEVPMSVISDGTLIWEFADDDYAYDDQTSGAQLPVTANLQLKVDDFGLPGFRKTMSELGILYKYVRNPNPTGLGDQMRVILFGLDGTGEAVLSDRTFTLDDGGYNWRLYAPGIMERPQTRILPFISFRTIDPNFTLYEFRLTASVIRRLTGQPL